MSASSAEPPSAERKRAAARDPAQGNQQAAGTATRRYRLLALSAAVLVLGILISWATTRPPEAPLPQPRGHIVFVDVEGWYRRTPNEVAALTPFELTLESLPRGLPLSLGDWQGIDRQHDAAVDRWFREPDLSIERTYRRADGEIVWLSAFGSRGQKSFHLFEHTPDTCYPLGGWHIEHFDVAHLPLGPLPLSVNHGVAHNGDNQLVFVYFYVWDTPARDAERGVLSFRIAAPVTRDPDSTLAVLAEDFLPQLFPITVAWARF